MLVILGLCLAVIAPWMWRGSEVQTIPVAIAFDKGSEWFNFPDLVPATQIQIDAELPLLTNKTLAVQLLDNLSGGNHSSEYSVELVLSRDSSLALSPDGHTAYVLYSYESIQSNDLPYLITQTILYHLLTLEIITDK
ncbi:hypothetical protein Cantr_10256 [Candida viswanathii]|uniref:Uncharacterized protein n=1 Tax=Candida viswanathii TaxID=5486 RepID=A0A367YBW5_9ASCO|nr:hypothetical protein Cantr_10256 [Candida viswanathii]